MCVEANGKGAKKFVMWREEKSLLVNNFFVMYDTARQDPKNISDMTRPIPIRNRIDPECC